MPAPQTHRSFVPAPDAEFAAYATRLSTRLTTTVTGYSIPAALATSYSAAYNTWVTAWNAAGQGNSNDHPGSAVIQAKNTARAALEQQMREINASVQGFVAVDVRANPGNMAADQALVLAFGLRLPFFMNADKQFRRGKTLIPADGPMLLISNGINGQLKMEHRNQDNERPGNKGRVFAKALPAGVTHVEVLCLVNSPAEIHAGTNPQTVSISRFPAYVSFGDSVVGLTTTICAKYVGTKGKQSAWSRQQTVVIPGTPPTDTSISLTPIIGVSEGG